MPWGLNRRLTGSLSEARARPCSSPRTEPGAERHQRRPAGVRAVLTVSAAGLPKPKRGATPRFGTKAGSDAWRPGRRASYPAWPCAASSCRSLAMPHDVEPRRAAEDPALVANVGGGEAEAGQRQERG